MGVLVVLNRPAIVIFDFDGTLADTFALTVDIFYTLRPQPVVLPKKEVDRLRGLAASEVAKELKIRWWELPLLLLKGKRMMAKRIHEAKLILGMDEVVRVLYERGHELHIVSSNTPSNIARLLSEYHLDKYFTSVRGNARLRGKARFLRKFAKVSAGQGADAYYIGDEVRDVLAAQAAGVRTIAVSWGYNNIHVLHESRPDYLVMEPDKILEIIK